MLKYNVRFFVHGGNMKKALSILLIISIFCGIFTIYPSATDQGDGGEVSTNIGTINTCVYEKENKKIRISGNIAHDFLINHSKHQIALYSIPEGRDYLEYLSSGEAVQIAKTDIAIQFEFSVNAESNAKRFASYLVVVVDGSGEMNPIGTPKYPSVPCGYVFNPNDKSSFKGIASTLTSVSVSANPSATIIPVELNKLLSNASVGHLYSLSGSYIYFDKAYIDSLDIRVKSHTSIGSAVYLQFLLNPSQDGSVTSLGTSGVPDMSLQQNLELIAAFADFLCERYNDRYTGTVRGIILGNEIDLGYELSGDISLDKYVDNYLMYMNVVSGVARQISSKIDITIPFSNADSYSSDSYEGICAPSELLELICQRLDENFAESFIFSTLIQSDVIPYDLAKSSTTPEGVISADNSSLYSEYINKLRSQYKNAPHSYIFNWKVDPRLSYEVLSTSYAYSYFKLLPDPVISSFVASFESAELNGDYLSYPLIADIVKKIDTSESFKVTQSQLGYLKAESWYQVVSNMYSGSLSFKNIYDINKISEIPSDIIGSYSYFDFSYQTELSSWFGGSYCDKIGLDYNDLGVRTLMAHFTSDKLSPSEFSELYCAYEYHESFIYTPYIALNFSIENDAKDKNALYEVKISIGSNKNVSHTRVVCSPYEEIELLMDFTSINETSTAEYITISVRCISGNNGGYSLCFSSLNGYSKVYLSNDLSNLIAEERLRIRNLLEEEPILAQKRVDSSFVIIGISVVVAIIGVGIFMCFKREEEYET